MKREIYRVEAYVVDANGSLNPLTGYPKNFDSRSYDNDLEKTFQRAKGQWNEALGDMSKIDSRQCQTACVIRISDGKQIYKDVIGKIADLPDPEPEPEVGE